jgi:hypothetical protein
MMTNAFLFHCIKPPLLRVHFHDLHVMEYFDIIAYKSKIESSYNNNGGSSSSMAAPSTICISKDALE